METSAECSADVYFFALTFGTSRDGRIRVPGFGRQERLNHQTACFFTAARFIQDSGNTLRDGFCGHPVVCCCLFRTFLSVVASFRAFPRSDIFHSRIFRGEVFRGRIFCNRIFRGGVFGSGIYRSGVLSGAIFCSGILRGLVLYDGVLRDKVLTGGILRGGVFCRGILTGGIFRERVLSADILRGSLYCAVTLCCSFGCWP